MKSWGEPINNSRGPDGANDPCLVPSDYDLPGPRSSREKILGQAAGEVTVGDRLVAAVIPSTSPPSVSEAGSGPLPMVDLVALYRDASILYSMGRVDRSGRVSERSIVSQLGWSPREPLQANVVSGMVVFQRDPHGPLVLTSRSYVPIPSSIQTRCGLHAGDQVLLVAAPEHDLLVAYTTEALDRMMTRHCESLIEAGNA